MINGSGSKERVNFIKPIREGFLYQRQHYQNTIKQDIYQNGCLDIEHLDAIRVAIKKDPALKNRVRVFPGYCKEKTTGIMIDEVVKELTKNDPPEEALPERSTLQDEEALEARDAEENRRNERSQQLNAKARRILKDSAIDEKKIFTLFLAACRQEEALWSGQQFAKKIMEGEQWVIPIRLDQNHFTTLVIHFSRGAYTIQYFDSLKESTESKNTIPEKIAPLVEGFEKYIIDLGYAYKKESFVDYSEKVQKDIENCGVFTFYASLYFVYQNAKREHPEGLFGTWVSVRDFVRNQAARLLFYREKMANLLKEEGYQTEFVNEPDPHHETKKSPYFDTDGEVFSWSAIALLSLSLIALLGAGSLWWGVVSLPLEVTQWIVMGQQAMAWVASGLPTNPALTFFAGAFSLTFITHFVSFVGDWMQAAPASEPPASAPTPQTKEPEVQLEKNSPTLLKGFEASKEREKEREKEEEIDPPCGLSPLRNGI